MRIVFAGTPAFAVPCLRAAHAHHEVVAVYTQPDRPAGRGRGLTPSPVKLEAIQRGIPVLQPLSLKKKSTQDALREMQPDVMIVGDAKAALNAILPHVGSGPLLDSSLIHVTLRKNGVRTLIVRTDRAACHQVNTQ